MTKLRIITLAIVMSFALTIGGLTSLAAAGTDASMLANPGAHGTSVLSGTGTNTTYPVPTSTPLPGNNNGITPRPGIGAGVGANIGGLGVGIGANVGGVGTYNGVMDNSRGYNQMSTDRTNMRGMSTNGIKGNYDSTPVRNYGVNPTTNRNMSWGWLGLLGLVGLAGIRTSGNVQTRQESKRS